MIKQTLLFCLLAAFVFSEGFGHWSERGFRGGRGNFRGGRPFPFVRPRPVNGSDILFCIDGNSGMPLIIDLRNITNPNGTTTAVPNAPTTPLSNGTTPSSLPTGPVDNSTPAPPEPSTPAV